MKVVMTFEFDELQRKEITDYQRKRNGQRGLPKYATREMLREFIDEALSNQWLSVGDELYQPER